MKFSEGRMAGLVESGFIVINLLLMSLHGLLAVQAEQDPNQTEPDSVKQTGINPVLYTQEIFRVYGASGANASLSTKKFMKLLDSLHIGNKYLHVDGKLVYDKEHRLHEQESLMQKIFTQHKIVADRLHPQEPNSSTVATDKCLSLSQLYIMSGAQRSEELQLQDFNKICPVLIQQQIAGKCIHHHHGKHLHHGPDHHKYVVQVEKIKTHSSGMKVWGYGLLSVTVISLTSLLAIVIIPFLGKAFYNKLMALLVALAIGTLSGDAMLHLIPHSLISHEGEEEGEEDHLETVWRASMVMLGIYVFFLVECVMKIKVARKTMKRESLHVHSPKMSKKQSSPSRGIPFSPIGSRLAGLHHHCSQENVGSPFTDSFEVSDASTTKEDRVLSDLSIPRETDILSEDTQCYNSAGGSHGSVQCCQQDNNNGDNKPCRNSEHGEYKYRIEDDHLKAVDSKMYSSLPGCDELHLYLNECDFQFNNLHTKKSCNSHCDDAHGDNCGDAHSKQHGDQHDVSTTSPVDSENHHHGHHGHSHEIGKNTPITSVAWMVVVGDGFHNLSDGLALGAAFSSSLTNGLTTSIAVFCHELPHELGDFAVLIKNGMTIKQAIAYNIASAIISYIGLITGLALGQIDGARVWILAFTAGLFLYIALVDLLPELSSQLTQGAGFGVFLFQNVGFLMGIGLMMVIALYEEKLSQIG